MLFACLLQFVMALAGFTTDQMMGWKPPRRTRTYHLRIALPPGQAH